MLILTRRSGEKIIIGEFGDIEIMVLESKGNQVRLGIKVPIRIPVYRDEICLKILCERQQKEQYEDKKN